MWTVRASYKWSKRSKRYYSLIDSLRDLTGVAMR
jgi:hypothetical protein